MARSRKGTHKRRSIWFNARAAWPRREARAHNLIRERARIGGTLPPHPGAELWKSVGPTNVGGRMTCAVCHPKHPERIWAGAAGGGLWKTEDGGQSWDPLWDYEATLNIGSLAIDPANPAILYCGTGEANLSSDSYAGVGIYRSIDGGNIWQLLASAEAAAIPTRIGSIAVDPFDPAHLRLGGVAHDHRDRDGMFVSHNGGLTWGRDNAFTSAPYRCHMVLFHPTKQDVLFATITARGSRSGIWRSIDGGSTWKRLSNGLPSGDAMGRTSIAFAPSKPSVMYALAENDSDTVLGVFKTTNGGAAWENVADEDHFKNEEQLSYGNTIVVHPSDPDTVICGGVDLHRTKDGGATWQKITFWDKTPGEKKYAHSDHHCLLMPAVQPGLVYSLNDGGLDVSTDSGKTWVNRSKGLVTSMFYDIDVAQTDGGMFGGGMQDNGTNVTFDGDPGAFEERDGGDGGWFIVNPKNAEEYYTTSYNMDMTRHRRRRKTSVTPPAKNAEKDKIWMMFLDMDPKDPSIVFAGGTRVWRTRTAGDTWKAVSDELDESPITAVEVARDLKTIYVGTENGGIFRSQDAGDTWSGDLSGNIPGFNITRLFASPDDPATVYVTVANAGASHVYRSNDAGDTWDDIDKRRLPDVPHHAIAIPNEKPRTVFVASDAGVFVSTNAGGSWNDLTRNLPNVQIVDLVYHDRDQTLLAASYGRGLWRIKFNV